MRRRAAVLPLAAAAEVEAADFQLPLPGVHPLIASTERVAAQVAVTGWRLQEQQCTPWWLREHRGVLLPPPSRRPVPHSPPG